MVLRGIFEGVTMGNGQRLRTESPLISKFGDCCIDIEYFHSLQLKYILSTSDNHDYFN
jgi:hypothetical protein